MKYSEPINFRAEPGTAEWLREEAERNGATISAVLREALARSRGGESIPPDGGT